MEEIRPIEMLLSKQQFQILRDQVIKAVTRKWLRTKDLPNYLSMADSTIRENLPGLPFHIVGGTKLYDPNEIDDYIKDL
ncbi:hypothetical protein NV391_06995 [Companilactobacillus crustorum]|uniref:hypothetical protein n=1 Tax=Companilactobacillus crustorum TaxID=392416 RepID=UPI00237DCE51|nr:hypothetical protein [Companilactobacillus crustorum]WDT64740.1 hypothetical protein NV391_06995 [Companilactobacillus crustorum]